MSTAGYLRGFQHIAKFVSLAVTSERSQRCYDFTPITDPTFDGSLPYGLGHRLRVLPTFVV